MDGMFAFFLLAAVLVCYLIVKALTKAGQPTGESFPFSEITADPNLPVVNTFCTKIRGVTRTNPDGTDRQSIIRKYCHSGDALCLLREPNNPVDCNAIRVYRAVRADLPDRKLGLGEQLGYISRQVAVELASDMDNGFVVLAKILDVTGAEYDHCGVNIEVEEYKPVQHL